MAALRTAYSDGADAILDAALARAEAEGWSALRLREVAGDMGITPADIRMHFREKNDLADAWLARADAAMLAAPPKGFADLPPPERIHLMVMRWLDALAPHRTVTREMFSEKLWPFHPHHYVPMVPWLSRTVQWLREAALLDGQGRRKQVEEIGLTALFTATLAVWCRDPSKDQERTRAWLAGRLARADRLMARLRPMLRYSFAQGGSKPGR